VEDKNDLVKNLCCGARYLVVMASNSLDEVCKPHAQYDSGTFITNIVYGCFSDTIDLMCGKYPDMETCQELEPEVTADMKEKIDKTNLLSNDTLLVSLIRTLERMDESIDP